VTTGGLTRRFVILRALRWLPVGLVLPFLVITPQARGLSLGAIGAVFAVHSAVAIALEVPSGALADLVGRRRVLIVGAALTTGSLLIFAAAETVAAFVASVALLASGRALISGSLEAWYVDSLRALDPAAPLTHGLSRGAAAEGVAMAVGSLLGGALVTIAGPGGGTFSGYGIAALAGAVAAVAYLIAVVVLVDERHRRPQRAGGASPYAAARSGLADIFRTARDELAGSPVVRIVFVTGTALGMSFTSVELLWQPRLADILSQTDAQGVAFGAIAAGSMLAAAVGAALGPRAKRGLGLRTGYLLSLAGGAVSVALLGAPGIVVPFVALYLLAYLSMGLCDPLHFELLNDAVGADARATLISADALATQGGALVANLAVGALAASHGAALVWALAGTLLMVTTIAVARPLHRAARVARA
jgi:MFS family permease